MVGVMCVCMCVSVGDFAISFQSFVSLLFFSYCFLFILYPLFLSSEGEREKEKEKKTSDPTNLGDGTVLIDLLTALDIPAVAKFNKKAKETQRQTQQHQQGKKDV